MSDQTERMEDALRRVIGEKIAAEGEAERLRAALREAEEELDTLVDCMNRGKGDAVNASTERVLGVVRSALVGTEASP